jgi:hypothetical protein
MASISSPYGFQAVSDQIGIARPLRIPFGIASGLPANIWKGQPVYIVAATGTLTPSTATTDKLFGIFQGVEYTPSGGRPAVSPYWPSGTTYDPTFDMLVYIVPTWIPSTRFRVQANGSVGQALLGAEFVTANFAAGSAPVGLSAATVNAAGIVVGQQGQWALVEFDTAIGSTIGDAFTDLITICSYPQVGPGSQTSIG